MRAETPLGPLKRLDGEPAFDEPWQAEALAIAATLVDAGKVSATDWAEALGAALETAERTGAPDTLETYYKAVVTAIEGVLGAGVALELGQRKTDWIEAYQSTPHGQPVVLK